MTTETSRLLLTDLLSAFMLLTRLPVARFTRLTGPPDFTRSVWAFPVVGLVVNGIGGLVYWLAYKLGMPPLLAAAWTLTATMIVTGAFHEDGLADTADGFGGGTTRARKLEIMRDSRIGSYGTLALILSVLLRTAAIGALARPASVMIAMILAGILGRNGIILLLMLLSPARADGMAASLGKPSAGSVAIGSGLSIIASLLLLPVVPAIVVLLLALGTPLLLAGFSRMQIGGHTGDVLGAGEVFTECIVLTALAGVFSA